MSDVNPYQPPRAPMSEPVLASPPTPGVWYGYVVYCLLMALLYAALILGGIAVIALVPTSEMDAAEAIIIAVLLIGMGAVLAIPYAAAPFLPRRSWTWILGIVLIGFGLTSCLTLPFCVVLLVFWFKPENQAFFGRPVPERRPMQ